MVNTIQKYYLIINKKKNILTNRPQLTMFMVTIFHVNFQKDLIYSLKSHCMYMNDKTDVQANIGFKLASP